MTTAWLHPRNSLKQPAGGGQDSSHHLLFSTEIRLALVVLLSVILSGLRGVGIFLSSWLTSSLKGSFAVLQLLII